MKQPTMSSASQLYYSQIINKDILGNKALFNPVKLHDSFKDIVTKYFRDPPSQFSQEQRIETAFAIVRKFSAVWSLFHGAKKDSAVFVQYTEPTSDLPPIPAMKIRESRNSKTLPKPGSLLLSHPM